VTDAEKLPPRDLVLLCLEARARGFKSALAFRRWCRRWGVPIHAEPSGRTLWVSAAEVDAGVRRATGAALAPARPAADNDLAAYVAAATGGK
jgi:hypothetical protein